MTSIGQISRAFDIASSRQNHFPSGVVISLTSHLAPSHPSGLTPFLMAG
jgi:hypothetical protein